MFPELGNTRVLISLLSLAKTLTLIPAVWSVTELIKIEILVSKPRWKKVLLLPASNSELFFDLLPKASLSVFRECISQLRAFPKNI